ncbi:MAG TPA: helix-turn-helix domain-containing protein [Haliangiales bacterium]|nr:helix-turn-helix domain-containing protein [Haliangiales bacterium]
MPPDLVASFLGRRAADGHPWSAPTDGLAAILAAHLDAGRAAWPDVVVEPERFAAHLAHRLPPDAGAEALAALRGSDLYLARACADGDAGAIAAFEARYFNEVDIAAARMRAARDLAAEVKQWLRRTLFVGDGTRPPAAADFAGRGDLRGWVRVTAVRELQRLLGKQKREVTVDDEGFLDALLPAHDPEMSHVRERYRRELQEAVLVATQATPARDRALLRYSAFDGLSIDEIGALYGVHRATAARWLASAREGILERTRAELARRLGVETPDVDSIIRLVQSRLEVSLERVL